MCRHFLCVTKFYSWMKRVQNVGAIGELFKLRCLDAIRMLSVVLGRAGRVWISACLGQCTLMESKLVNDHFSLGALGIFLVKNTHTHTHTHIYIYISLSLSLSPHALNLTETSGVVSSLQLRSFRTCSGLTHKRNWVGRRIPEGPVSSASEHPGKSAGRLTMAVMNACQMALFDGEKMLKHADKPSRFWAAYCSGKPFCWHVCLCGCECSIRRLTLESHSMCVAALHKISGIGLSKENLEEIKKPLSWTAHVW